MNLSIKIFLSILLIVIGQAGFCQKNTRQKKQRGTPLENLEAFDLKKIHFGFALGINSADFIMDHNLSLGGDSLMVLESKKQSGFNLGIITDLHLGPYFDLRFIPTLSFAQRNLEYTYLLPDEKLEKIVKPVESTFLDFPLNLKYRSARQVNFATYILVGGKYSYDLASQHKTDNANSLPSDIVVKLNKHSYMWEVGIGFDFFLKYFKFSPELKMSYGLNNLIIKDNTIFSDPITSLKSKIFTISFNFEG